MSFGSLTFAHLLDVRTVTVGVSSLHFHISHETRNFYNLFLLLDHCLHVPSNHVVRIRAVFGLSI